MFPIGGVTVFISSVICYHCCYSKANKDGNNTKNEDTNDENADNEKAGHHQQVR